MAFMEEIMEVKFAKATITPEQFQKIAYCIQGAYQAHTTRESAIDYVNSRYLWADKEMLNAMWFAIDAYIDING